MKKYLIFKNSANNELYIDPTTIFAIEETGDNILRTKLYCVDRTEPFSIKESADIVTKKLKDLGLAEFTKII